MKKSRSYIDIIMNPTRSRIIQYLVTHRQATASDIALRLNDISKATLYRHINVLEKNRILLVAEEHKIRGTVEKVYILNEDLINHTGNPQNSKTNVWNLLMNLYRDFDVYFDKSNTRPIDDRIFINSQTLSLSDKDYDGLITELQEVVSRYGTREQDKHARRRRLTIISSPGNKKFF